MAKKRLNKRVAVLLSILAVLVIAAAVVAVIVMQPPDPKIFVKQAEEATQAENWQEAVLNYIKAVKATQGRNPEYLVALGDAMMKQLEKDPTLPQSKRNDLFRDARDQYVQALVYDPKNLAAQRALTKADLIFAHSSDDWPPYIDQLNKLIALEPNNPELIFQRAGAEREAGKVNGQYIGKAIEDFRTVIQQEPQKENYWIELADLYHNQKQDDAAEVVYQESLKANPKSVNLRVQYAQLLSTLENKKDKVLPLLKEAIEQQPKSADGYLAMGQHLYQEKQIDEAKKSFAKAIEVEPGNYRPYFALSRILLSQRDQAGAEAVLTQGLESLRKLAGAQLQGAELAKYREGLLVLDHELADLLLDQLSEGGEKDKTDKLRQRIDQALEEVKAIFPGSPIVPKLQGRLAYIDGRVVEAEKLLRRSYDAISASAAPIDGRTAELLIQVYYRLNQLGEARRILERYLQFAKGDPQALTTLLRLHIEYRQYDQAQKLLRELMAARPNDEELAAMALGLDAVSGRSSVMPPALKRAGDQVLGLFLDRARQLWMEGDQLGAIELARQVIDRNDKLLAAHLQLAQWLKARNDQQGLRAAVVRAQASFKDYPVLVQRLALLVETDPAKLLDMQLKLAEAETDPLRRAMLTADAYRAANQPDKYLEWLQKAEAECKDKPHPTVVNALFEYALGKTNWDMAAKYAAIAGEQNFDEVNGRLYRARSARAQQKWDDAIALCQEALRIRPRFSDLHSFLGVCLLGNKNLDEARREFELAYNQNPANVEALLGLAYVSEQAGRQAEYAQWISTAFRFVPNNPEVREQYLQLREAKENPDSVIRMREEQRRLQPNNRMNLVHLAALYTRRGNFDGAEQIYRQLYASSGSAEDVRMLAYFLRRVNQDAAARTLLSEFVGKAQDKPAAYILWADYLDTAGDAEQAKNVYLKALAANPKDPRGYSAMAAFAYRHRDNKEAANWQQKLVDLQGKDASLQAQYQLAEYLIEAKMLSEAQSQIDNLLNRDPNDIPAHTLRGRAYLAAGEMDKAKEELDRAIREKPNYVAPLVYRAEWYLAKRDTRDAIEDFKSALKIQPSPLVSMRLAGIYTNQNDFENARTTLEGLLNDQPGFPPAMQAMISLCARFKKWVPLERALDEAKKADPSNPEYLINEGQMWQQRGEPLRALASLDAAAKLSPGDAKLSLLRMEVLAAANRPDQAIAEGKTLLNHPQVGPQALAVVALAKVKKKDASADADFAEAVKTSKSIDQLLYVVAQLRLAYPAQVAEKLKQWQALRPDDWAVLKVLAELSQDLATQEKDAAKAKGYFNDAAGFLDKAMPLTKEPRDKAAVLRHMGLVHQLAGGLEQDAKARLEQSAKAYEECLKIEPDDGGTLNNVAWMLAKDLNRPDEALPYARRAVSLMPDNPDVLDTLGLTLILKGDLNEAEKALDKSIDIHPSASNLLHRGMILEKRNQKSDAARQYRMAWDFVKQSPQDANHKDVKEALKRVGEPVKD